VIEFLSKKQPGCDRTPDHNHSFPHNARPHHAGAAQRLYQKEQNRHPCQYTEHEVVMLAFVGEPLQVGVSYELGGRHGQHVHETHIVFPEKLFSEQKSDGQLDTMVGLVASGRNEPLEPPSTRDFAEHFVQKST
jgi:hypothetical protein